MSKYSTLEVYKPTPTVEQFAGMSGDMEFDPGAEEYWMETIQLPIAYFVIGMLALILYMLHYLCFWHCCPCGPGKKTAVYQDNSGKIHYKKFKPLFFLYYGAIITVFISAQMIFIGEKDLRKGFLETADILKDLNGDVFTPVATESLAMKNTAIGGNVDVAAAKADNCDSDFGNTLDDIGNYFTTMTEAATSMNNMVKDVPSYLDQGEEGMNAFAAAVGACIFAMYAFYIFIVVTYIPDIVLEFLAESKLGCDLSGWIRCFIEIKVIITWGIEFIGCGIMSAMLVSTMVLSDWCMDPTYLTIKLITGKEPSTSIADNGNSTANMMAFYLYTDPTSREICAGNDILKGFGDQISSGISSVSTSLTAVSGSASATCSAHANTITASNNLMATHNTATFASFDCEVINNKLTKFFEQAVCKFMTTGIGQVWTANFFTLFFLGMVMFCAGICGEYLKHPPENRYGGSVAVDTGDYVVASGGFNSNSSNVVDKGNDILKGFGDQISSGVSSISTSLNDLMSKKMEVMEGGQQELADFTPSAPPAESDANREQDLF